MEATIEPAQQEIQHDDTKWYVLRVVSGKERKVKEYLDKEVNRSGWSETIKQVFLPWKKYIKSRMVRRLCVRRIIFLVM
jgi:transcriptional antiterminator NusG